MLVFLLNLNWTEIDVVCSNWTHPCFPSPCVVVLCACSCVCLCCFCCSLLSFLLLLVNLSSVFGLRLVGVCNFLVDFFFNCVYFLWCFPRFPGAPTPVFARFILSLTDHRPVGDKINLAKSRCSTKLRCCCLFLLLRLPRSIPQGRCAMTPLCLFANLGPAGVSPIIHPAWQIGRASCRERV